MSEKEFLVEEKRGGWGSNLGFIMAAVGSAVGLGNIWGFPYKMGMSGGGVFLIVYIILAIFVGCSVMLGELAIGRRAQRGAVGAYRALAKKYAFVGYFGVFCAFSILSFYSVLGGIVLKYMCSFFVAIFNSSAAVMTTSSGDFFGGFTLSGSQMMIYYAIFMLICVVIVKGGISGGIEKFSKVAMPALAIMLLVVIVYVATLPGASGGYKFMFGVNMDAVSELGFWSILKTAAGQMFFSLSLGMGAIATYGSYLAKKESLVSNSVIIVISDTIVALMAGLAVMPGVFAFGLEPGGGPGLLFVTLHTVFAEGMGGFIGALMGFIFYLLVSIAAITSAISLLEVCVSFLHDNALDKNKPFNRTKATLIMTAIVFVVGIPVALDGLGAGSAGGAIVATPAECFGMTDKIAGWNDCWLDFYDMLSEGILMPLGAMLMAIIIAWAFNMKPLIEEVEATPGRAFRSKVFFNICLKFIVPIIMVVVLYAQIRSFFG